MLSTSGFEGAKSASFLRVSSGPVTGRALEFSDVGPQTCTKLRTIRSGLRMDLPPLARTASAPSGSLHVQALVSRPASVSQSERKKKERSLTRLEPGALLKPDNTGERPESFEVLAEDVFKSEARNLTDRIDEMAKNIRLDGLAKKQDRKPDEEVEEKRRLEAEKRLARKREQALKDPKKKVALALENRRRFSEEQKGVIPMRPVQISGPGGNPESVPLVDVQLIRSRMQLLDQGATVATLIENQIRREKSKEGVPGSQSHQLSMPSVSSELTSGKQELCYEERFRLAQEKREVSVISETLRKLAKMRGNLPGTAWIDTKAIERALFSKPHMKVSNEERNTHLVTASTCSLDTLVEGLVDKLDRGDGGKFAQQLDKLCKAGGQDDLETRRHAATLRKSKNRSKSAFAMRISAEREVCSHRLRVAWKCVRALSQTILLYRRVQRRNHASHVIKVVLGQLGEWARIRIAMVRVKKAVKFLQRSCRQFLDLKRERCVLIAQDWQRIEDKHLASFFNKFSEQLVQEQAPETGSLGQRAKNKSQGSLKELLEGLQGRKIVVNWKNFRIPSKERSQIISSFYMNQLRTKIRLSAGVYESTKEVMQMQRDVRGFLGEFGVSLSRREGLAFFTMQVAFKNKVFSSFWEINEDMMLQCICLGAHLLAAKGVRPFSDHPTFKELPGSPWDWQSPLDLKQVAAEQGMQHLDRAVFRIMQRILVRQQIAEFKHPLGEETPEASITICKLAENNLIDDLTASNHDLKKRPKKTLSALEDVFEGFAPRLREIQEQQLLEYRTISKTFEYEHNST